MIYDYVTTVAYMWRSEDEGAGSLLPASQIVGCHTHVVRLCGWQVPSPAEPSYWLCESDKE